MYAPTEGTADGCDEAFASSMLSADGLRARPTAEASLQRDGELSYYGRLLSQLQPKCPENLGLEHATKI